VQAEIARGMLGLHRNFCLLPSWLADLVQRCLKRPAPVGDCQPGCHWPARKLPERPAGPPSLAPAAVGPPATTHSFFDFSLS